MGHSRIHPVLKQYSDVRKASRRLKAPSIRMFLQKIIYINNKTNIELLPLQRASNVEGVSIHLLAHDNT